MRFKRTLAMILAAAMCGCIAVGCSDNGSSSENLSGSQSAVQTEEADAPAAVINDEFDTSLNAVEFTAKINVGWNLGNTLDATGTGLSSETAWGNPETTADMIQAVKDAGFNAIRLPVTWEGHMDESYTIDPEWMARIKTVVDYAYDREMYIILNTHHEEWCQPYPDHQEEIAAQLKACWTQIAEEFKGYDEHLIFEGMNEPRWKNTQWEWNGGSDEGRAVVNYLNNVFIDTVRATGGNNEYRFLMICPYAANCGEPALSALEIKDPERTIVSVHAYIPYNFALADNGSAKWVESKPVSTQEIDTLADVLNRLFVSKGIAVIIGETGARLRYYDLKDDDGQSRTVANDEFRAAWAEYFFGTFKQMGIPAFWWDNGAFLSGEAFGLLKRGVLYGNEWKFPEVVEGIMKGAGVK
ncbi:MAG: glycoside hydrolase family 5 protein [Oscillospiraceae bacterium]